MTYQNIMPYDIPNIWKNSALEKHAVLHTTTTRPRDTMTTTTDTTTTTNTNQGYTITRNKRKPRITTIPTRNYNNHNRNQSAPHDVMIFLKRQIDRTQREHN